MSSRSNGGGGGGGGRNGRGRNGNGNGGGSSSGGGRAESKFFETPEELKSFSTLIEQLSKYSVATLVMPFVLVLVAVQSSGKSLLIDLIVGFPVTYSRSGTCTRCCVSYTLGDGVEHCTVGGVLCDLREVSNKVKDHMNGLAERGIFSEVDLEVVIHRPGLVKMCIRDTPGLLRNITTDKERQDAATIQRIVSKQFANAAAVPVVIVGAQSTDDQHHFGLNEVNDCMAVVKPKWREEDHVILYNYVNMALEGMPPGSDMFRTFFKSILSSGTEDTYFCMLNPYPGQDNVGTMTPDAKKAFIDKVSGVPAEVEIFNTHVARIYPNGPGADMDIVNDVRKRMGVGVIRESLRSKMVSGTKRTLPFVSSQVTRILKDCIARLRVADQQLGSMDVDRMMDLYHEYISDYVASMRCFMDVKRRQEHAYSSACQLDPHKYAQTFRTELQAAHRDGLDAFEGLPSCDQIITEIGDLGVSRKSFTTSLAKRLQDDFPLVGWAAIERFLSVYDMIVHSLPLPEIADHELYSIGLAPQNGVYGQLSLSSMLHSVVQRAMQELSKTIDWFTNHLKYLYTRHHDNVEDCLTKTPRYSTIRTHNEFHRLVHEKFFELIGTTFIDNIKETLQEIIAAHAETVDIDWPEKILVGLALGPGHATTVYRVQDVGTSTPATDEEDLTDAGDTNPQDGGTGTGAGASSASAKPQKKSWTQKLRQGFTFNQTKTVPPAYSAMDQRVCRLNKVRHALSDLGREISLLDVIEGGFTSTSEQCKLNLDKELIIRECQKHFYYARLKLLDSVHRQVEYMSRQLTNQHFNRFQREMEKILADRDKIQTWISDKRTLDRLRAEKEECDTRVKELQKLKIAIDDFDRDCRDHEARMKSRASSAFGASSVAGAGAGAGAGFGSSSQRSAEDSRQNNGKGRGGSRSFVAEPPATPEMADNDQDEE